MVSPFKVSLWYVGFFNVVGGVVGEDFGLLALTLGLEGAILYGSWMTRPASHYVHFSQPELFSFLWRQ